MAFYFYLSTKIIMVFITKSYQDLFGVRSYINAIISGAPKHNLPCSLEHEFFFRKIEIWWINSFPPIKPFCRHLYHSLNTQNRSYRDTWAV